MDSIRFLAKADLLHALRSKETLVWTFVMPLLFFAFFSGMNIGGGGGGGGGTFTEPLWITGGENGGALGEQLEVRLEEQGYQVRRQVPGAVAGEGEPEPFRFLDVPADLTDRALAAQPSVLRLRREAGGLSGNYDDYRVGRAVYTVLADLAVLSANGEDVEAPAFDALATTPRALTLEVAPAGKRKEIPSGKEQSIPGLLVMFTLIVLLTAGAVPMVIERRDGLLRRLASTPISRLELITGRWLSTFALGMVQILYALLVGALVFGMDWGPNVLFVALILVPWAAFVSSLSLLLGCLATTEGQAIGVGVLASNVLAALGGCWWPIEITPGWMQDLGMLLPTGWIMDAMHELVSFQAAPASVLPHAAVMIAGTLVVGWLGARRFRYS